MSERVNILTPVGRLVQGSLYKPSNKDAEGKPLTFATGEPRVNYYLGLAIPKDGRPWNQTEWGALIYDVGRTSFPQAHTSPLFSWKVVDGDDQTSNTRGKRACDAEGFPGNWIIKFSGSFAPKVFRQDNGAYVQVTEPDYIKAGYYVQISGSIAGNGKVQKPGVYLNPSMVAFTAYGQEIHFGPDANSVGFGKAALPAGALATPVASSVPLPAVVPNPGFLQGAPVYAQPAANVPAPPAPVSAPTVTTSPSNRMTAKAAGSSYRAFQIAGWKDEDLVAQGYMTI